MSDFIDWIHDDITWCLYDECSHTECERNIANRRTKGGMYSASDFRNTDYCLLKVEDKTNDK